MTSNNTQAALTTAPQAKLKPKNTKLPKEIAGNLASQPNMEQITGELQRLSQSPEFLEIQAQIQAMTPYLENITRFYSTKDGKLDEAKMAKYPLSQIITNASKSLEDKIAGIEQRRGQVLTDQQKNYIKTMEHKDIFSRTTQEGAQLIRDLMSNGFSKEQAIDVCNNGECGIERFASIRGGFIITLGYFVSKASQGEYVEFVVNRLQGGLFNGLGTDDFVYGIFMRLFAEISVDEKRNTDANVMSRQSTRDTLNGAIMMLGTMVSVFCKTGKFDEYRGAIGLGNISPTVLTGLFVMGLIKIIYSNKGRGISAHQRYG